MLTIQGIANNHIMLLLHEFFFINLFILHDNDTAKCRTCSYTVSLCAYEIISVFFSLYFSIEEYCSSHLMQLIHHWQVLVTVIWLILFNVDMTMQWPRERDYAFVSLRDCTFLVSNMMHHDYCHWILSEISASIQ